MSDMTPVPATPDDDKKLISDFEKAPVPEGGVDSFMLGLHDAVLSGWFNNKTAELMTGVRIGPDDIVVDVGCGDGGCASFCARQGAHVILVDVDGSKIHDAKERVKAAGARQVDIHISDCNPIPLAENAVTRVVCTEVLEHVDDPVTFMAELVRVGRPGALYVLTVPGTEHEKLQKDLAPKPYFEKPNHIRILEREEFAELVEGAGLEIVHRTFYGFYWSVWWLIFWQTEVRFGQSNHPSLEAWARCWDEVLKGKDGMRIKKAFDDFMPKSQVIIARKPG